jgi:hypothetical protein
MYAFIAEKTGWTTEQISAVNLDAMRSLMEGWLSLSSNKKKGKSATPTDVKAFQALAKSFK